MEHQGLSTCLLMLHSNGHVYVSMCSELFPFINCKLVRENREWRGKCWLMRQPVQTLLWLNDLVSVRKRPLQRASRQVIRQLRAGSRARAGKVRETGLTPEDARSHVCSSLQFNLSHKDGAALIHHVFYFSARRLNLSHSRRGRRRETELLKRWKMGSLEFVPRQVSCFNPNVGEGCSSLT